MIIFLQVNQFRGSSNLHNISKRGKQIELYLNNILRQKIKQMTSEIFTWSKGKICSNQIMWC